MNPFPLIEVKNKTPDQLDQENKLQGVRFHDVEDSVYQAVLEKFPEKEESWFARASEGIERTKESLRN